MKKITALFVASTLALGAANLAHAADATATPTDNAPMMHHKRGPAAVSYTHLTLPTNEFV